MHNVAEKAPYKDKKNGRTTDPGARRTCEKFLRFGSGGLDGDRVMNCLVLISHYNRHRLALQGQEWRMRFSGGDLGAPPRGAFRAVEDVPHPLTSPLSASLVNKATIAIAKTYHQASSGGTNEMTTTSSTHLSTHPPTHLSIYLSTHLCINSCTLILLR